MSISVESISITPCWLFDQSSVSCGKKCPTACISVKNNFSISCVKPFFWGRMGSKRITNGAWRGNRSKTNLLSAISFKGRMVHNFFLPGIQYDFHCISGLKAGVRMMYDIEWCNSCKESWVSATIENKNLNWCPSVNEFWSLCVLQPGEITTQQFTKQRRRS